MRVVLNFLVAALVGALSAILGWFVGYAVGWLTDLRYNTGLGAGLPTLFMMDVAAYVFGIVGFAACLVWLHRKHSRRQH